MALFIVGVSHAVCGVITAVLTLRTWRRLRTLRVGLPGAPAPSRAAETLYLCAMAVLFAGYIAGAAALARPQVAALAAPLGFFLGGVLVTALAEALAAPRLALARALHENSRDVLRSFVHSIEMKDPYTQGHSRHVCAIAELLYPRLSQEVRAAVPRDKLLDAALLHDIGKIGVPDGVLSKKGPLSDAQWEQMRRHPHLGKQMLDGTVYEELGDWILYHHERTDGAGYYGLAGVQIPVAARIIALADSYSAMTTDREYRPRRTHAEALALLREVAGTQLDAELVDQFAALGQEELDGLARSLRSQRQNDTPEGETADENA